MAELFHRASQQAILGYQGGLLGISAVPGAGKTHVLSALAARIIEDGRLARGQEVLVVTLTNSSVENFKARIKGFFDRPLVGMYKYRVRTLHALAHDFVRERPGRVGLEDRFSILDERESVQIRADAVRGWMAAHAGELDGWMKDGLSDGQLKKIRGKDLPALLESVAVAFIRTAKDHGLTPEALGQLVAAAPGRMPLAEMGLEIYVDYQRALAYRGAVDFDDLIRLALTLLQSDPDFLARLRQRFPFVLEDEAQDSSVSQESILRLLSGPGGNWVRVGDTNQAIFESFTTASPALLREFVRKNPSLELPESGRSQPAIIELANHLIDWVMSEHPLREARDALSLPHIQPVGAGDTQPNPPLARSAIHLSARKYQADDEISAVVESISKWLPRNPDKTVAVLVPRNTRGSEVISALESRNIQVLEFLASTSNARQVVGALEAVLVCLADPQSPLKLSEACKVWRDWRKRDVEPAAQKSAPEDKSIETAPTDQSSGTSRLRKYRRLEDFFTPRPGIEWQAGLGTRPSAQTLAEMAAFREIALRWQAAAALPIDQLVLTVAPDLFRQPPDLALAYKLAITLRRIADAHPGWRLEDLGQELGAITRNARGVLGFAAEDVGIGAQQQRGKVVVTTLHKAKGLEWDRVYMLSVSGYDFPSGDEDDTYFSEKWFVRGGLNLEAEALDQLAAISSQDKVSMYQEGDGSRRARLEYVRERLRLIYVGITRAREELIVTWNSGRSGDVKASRALQELRRWWTAAADSALPD